ncbi:hypothetical protein [Corynebacterium jeddahense]|uniref:Uncharacterized protein n=1 Tax=Corynebacterium jeddahense TaxID=1414719 RepID=A0ABY7UIG2_9CORY|nr:hypothetical protein [Corynebacterium jeddahense]WCZ37951.1 hypothetical protein CJEDD_01620 [Corynebacterium jeddahense]
MQTQVGLTFVSNGGWIDGNTGDGVRLSMEQDFTDLYVFNLRGNQRTAGEQSRKEGGKVFGPVREAPSGLFNMVLDAQRYIHNRTIQTKDGRRLANFVALHAGAIANQFPAADDLLELIIEQTAYIARQIEKRVGASAPRPEARHNSTVICALLAQQGVSVTPELPRKWAERGKISSVNDTGGSRNEYLLSEVLRRVTDKHDSQC